MPDQVDWRSMEREAPPGRAVGRLLKDQREARGFGLEDVAKRLRIRRMYLEAIEEGRFEQLPGAAYVRAFLRAYATDLGLDPEKVVTAYQLSGPVPVERPVAQPADFPIVERRAPIGLAVLTVLLVIAAGYAVWHYMPYQDAVVAQKVPPVPDRLLATQNTAPAAKQEVAEQRPAAAPVAVGETSAPAATPVPPHVWPAPKQENSASAPAPLPPVVAIPAPPPPVVVSVPSIGQAQAAQTVTETPRAAEPAKPAAEQQEAVSRPAPAPAPAVDQGNAGAAAPTAPVKSDTHVVARSNSWIELRSPAGDVLAQTYVRAGESYTVPAGISYRIITAR